MSPQCEAIICLFIFIIIGLLWACIPLPKGCGAMAPASSPAEGYIASRDEAEARKARSEKFRQRRLAALSQACDELERWEA